MPKTASPSKLLRYGLLPQICVLTIYVWYLTAGLWTRMPATFTTSLYDQLANAFQHGHTYLDRVPAPDLLALPDPYVVQQRKQVSSYIGDATLFHSRYYLYWGPAPALLLLLVKTLGYAGNISDAALVFAFIAGLFLLESSLLLLVWRDHFADTPFWTALAGILVIGLITPMTWMLNEPLIYGAALAAGQFFFMAGVLEASVGLRGGSARLGWLLAAGLCWAVSIACQFTLVLPVAFVAAWTALNARGGTRWLAALAALGVPLAGSLMGLGWYNWIRFGSVLEFGYRYQLAVVNLHEHYREIFSALFVAPNAFNYLVNPPQLQAGFPFIIPQYGRLFSSFVLPIPRIYYTEAITGLLLAAPFALLALWPVWVQWRGLRKVGLRVWIAAAAGSQLHWLQVVLIGTSICVIGVLVLFFYSAPRYTLALMPSAMLLSMIGLWSGYRELLERAAARRTLLAGGTVLALISIVVSSLIAISSSLDRFNAGNPTLIQHINAFLGR